jgi:hypothetical protein
MTVGAFTTTTAATSLELKTPKLGQIANGGYWIAYSGKIPAGASLLLGVPDAANAIDVTHKNHNDLIDKTNQARFLALIGNACFWGTTGRCRLFLKTGGKVDSASSEVTFDCPVKPLVCRPKLGGPTLGLSRHELDGLTYAGVDAHGHEGRFLRIPALDSCYYFQNGSGAHAGQFEVDNAMRGLVCTSYIGAVWGIGATPGGPMTWPGSQIASCVGTPFYCTQVGIKNAIGSEVKNFFEQHKNETFLVGKSGHIVLVARGEVHEFNVTPRRGYNHNTLSKWDPKGGLWTVGKPTLQF